VLGGEGKFRSTGKSLRGGEKKEKILGGGGNFAGTDFLKGRSNHREEDRKKIYFQGGVPEVE